MKHTETTSVEWKVNLEESYPQCIKGQTPNVNTELIQYDNEEYLYFIDIQNQTLKVDDTIKAALNYDETNYLKTFYNTLLKKILNQSIPQTFKKLSEKYEFDVSKFTCEHIQTLKEIYDIDNCENYYKYNQEILKFLKKAMLIRYVKDGDYYTITKKGGDFLLEFNANVWTKKYTQLPEKHNQYLKNFEETWFYLKNEIQVLLMKENRYINTHSY